MSNFIDQEITRIRNLVGERGQVLGAVVRFIPSSIIACYIVSNC